MPRMDKLSAYNTVVIDDDNKTKSVIYHTTKVVTFGDDTITLRTGGWKSKTTKQKMNQTSNQFHLGYRVFQRGDKWFVILPKGDVLPFDDREISFTKAGELV